MKKFVIYPVAVFFFCFFLQLTAMAQYKIILHTKTDIALLKLKNNSTGAVVPVPVWNKSGGGYLLEINSLSGNSLISEGESTFQVYRTDTKQLTEWIGLQRGAAITFEKCFKDHLNISAGANGTVGESSEFVASMFSGYAVSESNTLMRKSLDFGSIVTFSEDYSSFYHPEDIRISWNSNADLRITKATLTDLNSKKTVWESDSINSNTITFNDLKPSMQEDFIFGHTYLVSLFFNENVEQSTFTLYTLEFITKNKSSFICEDSLSIEWKTEAQIQKASIWERNGDMIWNTNSLEANSLKFNDIQNQFLMPFKGAYQYRLKIELTNGEVYELDFEILLDNEEYQKYIDFLKN